MGRYLIGRLLGRLHALLIVSVITFSLVHATPGGPWDREHRCVQSTETEAALIREFGLDKPTWLNLAVLARGDVPGFLDSQFITYMFAGTVDGQWRCGFVCGNMGTSFSQRDKMIQDILFRPPELASS